MRIIDIAVNSNAIDCSRHQKVRVVGGGTVNNVYGVNKGDTVEIQTDGTSTTFSTSGNLGMKNQFVMTSANDLLKLRNFDGSTLVQVSRNKNA